MQKRITKDLFTYLPGKALPALAAFITVPIYTRLFSPDEYGKYALAVAASEFLLLGTITGLGQAAVRFFSAYQIQSRLSNYFAAVYGGMGLITVAVATVSAGILVVLRSLIPVDLYILLWGAVVLYVASAINATMMDVLRGQEKSRWYSIIWIGQCYGGIAIGLILVLYFRMNIAGIIWGQIIGLLLPVFPLFWLTTRKTAIYPSHVKWADLHQLLSFAMPFTIGNVAFWSLSLADRYFIQIFRGSYEVGLYSVATKIPSRSIQLIASLFFLVPAPIISRLWEEHGRKAAEEALTGFTRMFFLMVIPSVVGLAVIAAPLLRLLAGKEYYAGYPAIWFAAFASMGLGLSDLGSSGSMVANRTRLIARNQCLAAGACFILNFILVPMFGFIGAALSAAVSFTLLAILQAITSARFLTWRWPLQSLWRVLIATLAMFTSVLLVQMGIKPDTTILNVVNLLLSVFVGALTYFAILWGLGEISPHQLFELFAADHRQALAKPATGETVQK